MSAENHNDDDNGNGGAPRKEDSSSSIQHHASNESLSTPSSSLRPPQRRIGSVVSIQPSVFSANEPSEAFMIAPSPPPPMTTLGEATTTTTGMSIVAPNSESASSRIARQPRTRTTNAPTTTAVSSPSSTTTLSPTAASRLSRPSRLTTTPSLAAGGMAPIPVLTSTTRPPRNASNGLRATPIPTSSSLSSSLQHQPYHPSTVDDLPETSAADHHHHHSHNHNNNRRISIDDYQPDMDTVVSEEPSRTEPLPLSVEDYIAEVDDDHETTMPPPPPDNNRQVSFAPPPTTATTTMQRQTTSHNFTGNHDYLEGSHHQANYQLGPSSSSSPPPPTNNNRQVSFAPPTNNHHHSNNVGRSAPPPPSSTTTTARPGAFATRGRPLGDLPVWHRIRRSLNGNNNNARGRGGGGTAQQNSQPVPLSRASTFGQSVMRLFVTTGGSSSRARPSGGGGGGGRDSSTSGDGGQRQSVMQRISTVFAGDASCQTYEDIEAERQHGIQQEEKRRLRTECWILLIVIILGTIIAVSIVFAGAGGGSDDDEPSAPEKVSASSTTDAPIGAPERKPEIAALRALLKHHSSDFNVLDDKSSPQYQALSWLSKLDKADYNWWDDIERLESRYALVTTYYATGGDNWSQNYRFLSSAHECDWTMTTTTADDSMTVNSERQRPGVSCNDENQVISMNLENNNLNGFIPEEIRALSNLQHLNMASNKDLNNNVPQPGLDFEKSFPTIIQLGSLLTLDVSNNLWNEQIPSSISTLSNIEVLHFEKNEFKFTIPTSIQSLSNLKELYLDGNTNLIGGIEDIVVDLQNLEILNVSWCGLTISPALRFPASLTSLSVGGNELSSSAALAAEIGMLSNLKVLEMESMDNLQGTIPSEIGMLTDLEVLRLDGNSIGGEFPWSMFRESASTLRELRVRMTTVGGQLPLDMERFSALEYLILDRSQIRGSIPDGVGDLASLVVFNAYGAGFQGTIPTTMGMMASLEVLDFGYNALTGRIPSEMAGMESLDTLHLQGNPLVGGTLEFLCPDGDAKTSSTQNISCSCCDQVDR